VNVAEVEPCATVTLEGTVTAAVLELDNDTTTPPLPAIAVRLTVPVPDWPLTMALGLTETLLKAAGGGLIVIPKVAFTPKYEAFKVTGVGELTVPAVTGNVTDVEPCGIVTIGGTFATAGDTLTPISAPPLRAADVSPTTQVDPDDGAKDVWSHERPFKPGVWRIVIVPPLTVVAIADPDQSAETPLVR